MAEAWGRDRLEPQELSRMQRDALERMRQMQARARRAVEPASVPPSIPSAPPGHCPSPSPPGGMGGSGRPAFSRDLSGSAGSDLDRLFQSIGGERMMLLALTLLLAREGASTGLLLALLYLLI